MNGKITFIDTPGPAASRRMRAAAQVQRATSFWWSAAADGVMPQRIEPQPRQGGEGADIVAITKY